MKRVWLGAALALLVCASSACAIQRGNASWYGEDYRGRPMADRGRPFDPDALTCASWFYAFGTILEVRHGDRTVFVIVTDRGPAGWVLRQRGVVIDLSRYAFSKIAPLERGVIPVRIRVARRVS